MSLEYGFIVRGVAASVHDGSSESVSQLLTLYELGEGWKCAGGVQVGVTLTGPEEAGNPNSWVEIDLMQEHLNYWIKVSIKLRSECPSLFTWFRSSIRPMDPMHHGSGLSQSHHVSMFFGNYQRVLTTY
jgi:hypothetical protein